MAEKRKIREMTIPIHLQSLFKSQIDMGFKNNFGFSKKYTRSISKRKKTFLLSLFFAFCSLIIFISCNLFRHREIVEAPTSIRESAYSFAEKYIGMDYEWGGQDPLPKGIDCSGLIINCYDYATQGTGYSLLFSDTTARNLSEKYTIRINTPQKGDLIFMGQENSIEVSHVAILEKIQDNFIYFIDSTTSEDPPIKGVSYRNYPLSNKKIKFFGRMLLNKDN